jgi:hypothetical protein
MLRMTTVAPLVVVGSDDVVETTFSFVVGKQRDAVCKKDVLVR